MTALRKLSASVCFLLALFAAPPGLAQPQGRLVTSQLQSTSFADSRIGISPVRNVTAYLPPRYSETGRRFPVLYFLNYFFEDHREPFATYAARQLLDEAIRKNVIGDVIVVTADFATPAGSSWYVNSSATGNWEDFMVRELVPHVDATYRTLVSRNSRGIVGDGPGGYGAIRFGMRHPELFGAVYGMQPVASGPGIQPTHSRPISSCSRARRRSTIWGATASRGYSRRSIRPFRPIRIVRRSISIRRRGGWMGGPWWTAQSPRGSSETSRSPNCYRPMPTI
ncbi:hypothetical protein E5A73_14725 [Sphingomonas gei]|uniref:Esterase family protein n=1 Tax=Sphingomonas gei TaxID=1395960 RepID=A0A4S1XBG9_9SPHN|nr:alpha/beta hydrolase-fold protein [Sphingomonas gei]TGX52877.1 hypothetical protein E5A73_14725 [Sphingomonas gei]